MRLELRRKWYRKKFRLFSDAIKSDEIDGRWSQAEVLLLLTYFDRIREGLTHAEASTDGGSHELVSAEEAVSGEGGAGEV